MGHIRYLLLAGLLAIFVFMADRAEAQAIDMAKVGTQACTLSNAGQLSPDDVWARSDLHECGEDAFSTSADHVWVVIDLTGQAVDFEEPVFTARMSYSGPVSLHVRYSDGTERTDRYSHTDMRARWRAPSSMSFDISSPSGAAPTNILFGIETPWDLLNFNDLEVASAAYDEAYSLRMSILGALFCGLMVIPLVLDLIFYGLLRRAFILLHMGMVAAVLAYSFSWSMLVFSFFPEVTVLQRSVFNHHILAVAMLFGALLVRSLTEEETMGRRWRAALIIAGIFPIITTTIIMTLAPAFPHTGAMAYSAAFIVPTTVIVGALVKASLSGSRIALVQLLGWTPIIIMTISRILRGIGVLDSRVWFDLGFYPSMLIEATVTAAIVSFKVWHTWRDAALERTSLRKLASTDPLTGVSNRRAFIQGFEQMQDAGLAERKTVGLLAIDIDHFKRVNDAHGHAGGDRVLVDVAKRLRAMVRSSDLCARFGGEEFCLVLTGKDARAIKRAAERVRETIAAEPFDPAGTITVSIGVVIVSADFETGFDSYYAAADAALYAAKAGGRNQVRMSTWRPRTILPEEGFSSAARSVG